MNDEMIHSHDSSYRHSPQCQYYITASCRFIHPVKFSNDYRYISRLGDPPNAIISWTCYCFNFLCADAAISMTGTDW